MFLPQRIRNAVSANLSLWSSMNMLRLQFSAVLWADDWDPQQQRQACAAMAQALQSDVKSYWQINVSSKALRK